MVTIQHPRAHRRLLTAVQSNLKTLPALELPAEEPLAGAPKYRTRFPMTGNSDAFNCTRDRVSLADNITRVTHTQFHQLNTTAAQSPSKFLKTTHITRMCTLPQSDFIHVTTQTNLRHTYIYTYTQARYDSEGSLGIFSTGTRTKAGITV